MQQLRRAKKEDLHDIAEFITDRFLEMKELALLSRGLSKPKQIVSSSTEASLQLFFSKGDVCIFGDSQIQGVLVGMPAKKFTFLNMFFSSLHLSKFLVDISISKEDAAALQENSALSKTVRDKKWYRKYSKNAYYINWIVIDKKSKGTGVFRKLITPILEKCEKEGMDIVLETNVESNVPVFEHFGFELIQTHKNEDIPLAEYCMMKRNLPL